MEMVLGCGAPYTYMDVDVDMGTFGHVKTTRMESLAYRT